MESFRHFNPDWDVTLHGGVAGLDSLREIGHASDRARYSALVHHGGLYFDTDIIFTSPIPDTWLERDNAMISRDGGCLGVACLGARRGSLFFMRVLDMCSWRVSSRVLLDYQAFGLKLFTRPKAMDIRALAADLGESMLEIDPSALFPYGWTDIELLWSPVKTDASDLKIGVHWFGGDMLSMVMEPEFSDQSMPNCLVASAVEKSMAAR